MSGMFLRPSTDNDDRGNDFNNTNNKRHCRVQNNEQSFAWRRSIRGEFDADRCHCSSSRKRSRRISDSMNRWGCCGNDFCLHGRRESTSLGKDKTNETMFAMIAITEVAHVEEDSVVVVYTSHLRLSLPSPSGQCQCGCRFRCRISYRWGRGCGVRCGWQTIELVVK